MSVATQPGQVAMMVKPSSFSAFASTAVSVRSTGTCFSAERPVMQNGKQAHDESNPIAQLC